MSKTKQREQQKKRDRLPGAPKLPENLIYIADEMSDAIIRHFREKNLLIPPFVVAAAIIPTYTSITSTNQTSDPGEFASFASQIENHVKEWAEEARNELKAMDNHNDQKH